MSALRCLLAMVIAVVGAAGIPSGARAGEAVADPDALARAIGARYGLRLAAVRTGVRFDLPVPPARDRELVSTLEALDRALARYPRRFLERAGLKEIRLVGAVRMPGARFGGYAEPAAGRITMDIAQSDVKATFDHELFHVFDRAFFDRVLRRNHELPHHNVVQTMHDDFEWRDLNTPGFHYTAQLACKAEASGAIEHPLAGFASWYATCDIAEDKANLFEHWMQPGGRARLAEIARRDRVLAAKLALLASRLRAFGLDIDAAVD